MHFLSFPSITGSSLLLPENSLSGLLCYAVLRPASCLLAFLCSQVSECDPGKEKKKKKRRKKPAATTATYLCSSDTL